MSLIGPSAQGLLGVVEVIVKGALVSNRPTSRVVMVRKSWIGRLAIVTERKGRQEQKQES